MARRTFTREARGIRTVYDLAILQGEEARLRARMKQIRKIDSDFAEAVTSAELIKMGLSLEQGETQGAQAGE